MSEAQGLSGPSVTDRELLGLLQLADSGFPSGAFTLSHGLETMASEGLIRTAADLEELLEVILVSRLGMADLPAVLAAHDIASAPWSATRSMERLSRVDRALRAVKLAREERDGSERVGRRLAAEAYAAAPSAALDAFLLSIGSQATPGNSAIAFGLAAAAFGVERRRGAVAAGSTFASAFAMAAVRLGLIGHRAGQLAIRRSAPSIERAVDLATHADPLDPRPCSPQLDVALARHETAPMRAFAS
ncbi:MAG: urease accessory protein [Deltaproteobacteria bacterium]|nr:MAG: urease accessory protein [Deltaproteobacteria bacterium]